MDQICFLLSIRQVTCQSGVPVVNEKTYTNLTSEDQVLLNNGYILTLSSNIINSVTLTFSNPALGINFKLALASGTSAVVDLPIEGGTFRIGVYVERRPCNICECCC